jgi:hypothetical protein
MSSMKIWYIHLCRKTQCKKDKSMIYSIKYLVSEIYLIKWMTAKQTLRQWCGKSKRWIFIKLGEILIYSIIWAKKFTRKLLPTRIFYLLGSIDIFIFSHNSQATSKIKVYIWDWLLNWPLNFSSVCQQTDKWELGKNIL